MVAIHQEEWLDQNAGRAYPFAENMRRLPSDAQGNLMTDAQIPNYLIVDFVITLPSETSVRVYLARLGVLGDLLSLVFRESTGDAQVATLAVDISQHTVGQGYTLTGSGDYSDARGRIVIGDLTDLATDLADGVYDFVSTQTLFEACTVRPDLRGLRTLRLEDGDGTLSAYITGHVKLVAGANVRLDYDAANNAVVVNGISGAGFSEECTCVDVGQDTVVNTINGIPVEDAWITGDGTCVDVSVQGNKIVISDSCSEPCCSCPELEFLTESLKILESSINNLEAYAQRLSERVSTFVSNFVLTVGA